jgi:hypothetical protein
MALFAQTTRPARTSSTAAKPVRIASRNSSPRKFVLYKRRRVPAGSLREILAEMPDAAGEREYREGIRRALYDPNEPTFKERAIADLKQRQRIALAEVRAALDGLPNDLRVSIEKSDVGLRLMKAEFRLLVEQLDELRREVLAALQAFI